MGNHPNPCNHLLHGVCDPCRRTRKARYFAKKAGLRTLRNRSRPWAMGKSDRWVQSRLDSLSETCKAASHSVGASKKSTEGRATYA